MTSRAGRRLAGWLLAVAVLVAVAPADAVAHAGLTGSDPAAGATLGGSPTSVRLSFSERPEASLSVIRVLDARGRAHQTGGPRTTGGDRLSLVVPVGRLGRGVYTVQFRVVSAVDGHASAGSYAFGVGVSPTGGAVVTSTGRPVTSGLELVARWILLTGLAILLGGAVAGVARFGGSTGSDLRLAGGGWLLAVAGLVLLAAAQRSTADSSLGDLLDTPVGRALIWRAVALGAAGAALLVARQAPGIRRVALLGAGLCALAAVGVHVAAGHAAAGPWSHTLTVSAQVVHFAAAGVWFGGLAALLLGVRGAPSSDKASAVRRFSAVALAMVVVVAATGTLRAVDELSSVGELVSSGYGRAILAKVVLLALIIAFAARNRRRSVPAAAADLRPLQRTSRVELGLAVVALGAAAVLGTLAPPVVGQPAGVAGLTATGADFATTVRARLSAASDQPGPNRFDVDLQDYDSQEPVTDARVRLRFTPLDDPGVEPTALTLRRAAGGTYAGTGANLAFDGRWGVAVLVKRNGDAVDVPLELDVRGPDHFVSVQRLPGRPRDSTMQIGNLGYIRISLDPERAGPSRVRVTCYTLFEDEAVVEQLVLTTAAGDGRTRQRSVRRLTPATFAADIDLTAGPFTITVVARTDDGSRLRGMFELEIPRG